MPEPWTKAALAGAIDHSFLKAPGTEREVRERCAEALEHGFASVCVNPYWVRLCVRELAGSRVRTSSVVGFPLGLNPTEIKAAEARLVVGLGAAEVDAVINIGAAKSGDWRLVEEDLGAVVAAAGGAAVKAVIETCYLDEGEKARACEAAVGAGARCVMTSTGFGTGGATLEDIRLIRRAVGPGLLVKASGGIRTCRDAILMLEAGADRIGASSGVAIVAGLQE